jgi:predicted alpha/beta superfamily hydrolase
MKRSALTILTLWMMTALAGAGELITIGETITLQSKVMGEERTILVSTPPGYEQSAERYPVLYMTDGDQHITHTRGTVDFLAANGLMPQLIIVGVTNTDRTRDLTPTRVETREVNGRVMQYPTSGGAGTFLNFFENELFPFIDGHYRTLPMRLFSGHSFGGLFALNAFFERPQMFRAVLAISPSLNWDGDTPIRQATSFSEKRTVANATLFVAMADEESGDPRPNLLDRLEAALAASKAQDFRWQVMRMPDEDHGSVVLRAQYWGLRDVFEGWRLPTDPETRVFSGKLDDLEQHYAQLSKRYGFSVIPGENVINQLGYQYMGREDLDSAIEVLSYNVELYPSSANVYDSLGEAYEKAGRDEEALAAYSMAVENATKAGDQRLGIFTANRDRARAHLAQTTVD